MSTIGGNYFNYSSPFFSNSSGGGMSSVLGDYMSLRNGSYKKLLRSYYAKQNKESDSSKKTGNNNTADKTVSKELKQIKTDSSALKTAADTLTNKNSKLFEKVTKTVKDENGNETTTKDYDWDAITSAVKSFTSAYNSTLDSAANQDNVFVLRKAAMMTKSTQVNKNLLNRVGITIGKDNKLTVDEEKLKKADMNDLKSLFSGSYGSYAANIGQRAADIEKVTEQMIKNAAKSNASTYTRNGSYSSLATGGIYDSFF
ncbi:MAG: hypothetical protein K2N94_08530 [Lachnospiraceae bacterium]|nr:hypothetical protein [Lachnospiraceae bacterium]